MLHYLCMRKQHLRSELPLICSQRLINERIVFSLLLVNRPYSQGEPDSDEPQCWLAWQLSVVRTSCMVELQIVEVRSI